MHTEDRGYGARRPAEHLLNLVENLEGLAYLCRNDPDWTMEYVSPGATALTGYAVEDLVQSRRVTYAELVHPEDREHVRNTVEAALTQGIPFRIVYRILDAGGNEKWVWELGRRVPPEEMGEVGDDDGPEMLEGLVVELGELQRSHEILTAVEHKYRSLFGSIRDAILVTDTDLRITDCNAAFTELFGYTLDEVRGKEVHYVYESRDEFRAVARVLSEHVDDPGFLHPINYQAKTGRVFPGETNIFYLRNAEGDIIGYIGLIRDVSERHEAYGHIQRLNRLLAVQSSVSQAIVRIRDPRALLAEACRIAVDEGRLRTAWIGMWNDAGDVLEMVGRAGFTAGYPACEDAVSRSEVRGSGLSSRALAEGTHQVSLDVRTDSRMEKWRDEAVSHGYLACAAFPLTVFGEVKGVLNLYAEESGFFDHKELEVLDELMLDISFALESIEHEKIHRQAEAELHQTTSWLHSLLEASPLAIIELDRDGLVRYWNHAAEEIFGWTAEEVVGGPVPYIPADKQDEFRRNFGQVIHGRGARGAELVRRRKDGSTVHISLDNAPVYDKEGEIIGVMSVIEDITQQKREQEERRQMELELTRAEKMGAVGRLAGGVAHDFNNMLNVIIGNTELALEKVGADEGIRKDLEEVKEAARRSGDLTRQLLEFTRSRTSEPAVIDLNEAIKSAIGMLARIVGESIEIHVHTHAEHPHVPMDESRLGQILVNLAVNARDAMSGFGTITIETENVLLDEEFVQHHQDASPGEHVLLSFSDTGAGMEAEVLEKIFEPFFTTKEDGSGFGLATVYGTVTQAGGLVHAYSEPGLGTAIKIHLPVTEVTREKAQPVGEEVPVRGAETVLVAEDQEQILRLVEKVLSRAGYSVLSAKTPERALELAGAHASELDLLVTDVVMPGMSGKDLDEKVRSLHPGIKTLYMSGYTADTMAGKGVVGDDFNFIGKPFTMVDFARKVREVLDG